MASATATDAMLRELGVNATRVSEESPSDISSLLRDGSIRQTCTVVDTFGESPAQDMRGGKCSRGQVAAVRAHLRAIRLALVSLPADGPGYALVLGVGVELFPELRTRLPELVASAPLDWEVLSLDVRNAAVLSQFARLLDPVVKWQREYWGADAYVVNRGGAQKLLDKFWPGSESAPMSLPDSIGPDWLLYRHSQSYVSTVAFAAPRAPPVGANASSDTELIRQVALSRRSTGRAPLRGGGDEVLATRGRRYLAVTTVRGDVTAGVMNQSVGLIVENALDLLPFGVDWCIYVVLWPARDPGATPRAGAKTPLTRAQWDAQWMVHEKALARVNLAIEYRTWHHQFPVFGKWKFYMEGVDKFAKYDFVMLHDDDMRFRGFPWRTFFTRHSALGTRGQVTGVVRRSTWPRQHLKTEPVDSGWAFMEARWWQECGRESVDDVDMEFVEQWFAVVEAKFFKFLCTDVIASVHTHLVGKRGYSENNAPDQFTSWGPDLVWCHAAAAFGGGCVLLPLTMEHKDWRAIQARVNVANIGEQVNTAYQQAHGKWFVRGHLFKLFIKKMKDCTRWRTECPEGVMQLYNAAPGVQLPSCLGGRKAGWWQQPNKSARIGAGS